MNKKNLLTLPDNLPIPEDDGACAHLDGLTMPSISLESTSGTHVNLGLEKDTVVVYIYPLIGRPGGPPMVGWNDIPGARGCTPQSCAFRDLHSELTDLGAKVYGLSAQPLADQKEAVERLHLPFALLNDSRFELTHALTLPTFQYESLCLIKRLTLVIKNGVIQKVFYPVFPPTENAANVIAWLKENNF